MKGSKTDQLKADGGASLLTKISSSLKDDCLDNLMVMNQRVEIQRNDKLTRYFQKANSILQSIKRQQVEMNDAEQLKSADLILLQLRLRDMEHKIKQLQSSLKIKINRLVQEEQALLSSFRHICKEIALEEIFDIDLLGKEENDPMANKTVASHNFSGSETKRWTEGGNNHKIIQQLVQEIQSFKQDVRSSTNKAEIGNP